MHRCIINIMADVVYYKYFYLLIVAICSLVQINEIKGHRGRFAERKQPGGLILLLFLILYIGFRPYSHDTIGISIYYMYNFGSTFKFDTSTENLIFDNVLLWFSSMEIHFSFFLILVATVYYGSRYISCKVMFPHHTYTAFLFFLAAFISYASAINGFKAGMAASVFCCAVAFRKRWVLAAIFLLISWGIHHSMHVCICAYVIVSVYRKTKVYYILWLVSALIAIAHINYFQTLFAGLTDEKGAGYLSLEDDGHWRTGLRIDFMLYSSIPILLGWYITVKKKIEDEGYQFVLNLYALLNSIWMLCMYASFTNRIAALSWFLYPIVLSYPFLSPSFEGVYKNKNLFIKVMSFHLLFTLFMEFVYYA